ncbi:hypothetical protein [Nocardia sp. NPDC057440]|uniref:hypothetical protein n=1 Tax=Nocardia sp. NPDC057440 TaxID=3346134 RepID=UPI00366C0AB3
MRAIGDATNGTSVRAASYKTWEYADSAATALNQLDVWLTGVRDLGEAGLRHAAALLSTAQIDAAVGIAAGRTTHRSIPGGPQPSGARRQDRLGAAQDPDRRASAQGARVADSTTIWCDYQCRGDRYPVRGGFTV